MHNTCFRVAASGLLGEIAGLDGLDISVCLLERADKELAICCFEAEQNSAIGEDTPLLERL